MQDCNPVKVTSETKCLIFMASHMEKYMCITKTHENNPVWLFYN